MKNNEITLKKKSKKLKIILSILLSVLLFISFLFYLFSPQDYYIERPGSTMSLSEMIQVEGKEAQEEGDFYLTSVTIMPANNFLLWLSKGDDFSEEIPKEDLMGDFSNEQYSQVNQYYMETAQNIAIYQAFKLAGIDYEMSYSGVYVMQVDKNSSFKDDLEIADTVTKVDGKSFKSSNDLIDYVASQKLGAKAEIDVTRIDGSEHHFVGKYITLSNGKVGIGIGLTDHTTVKTDIEVEINSGSIGGPSAGAMFTLEIYEQLTGENLVKGRNIAGTGTIEEDGTIGQIGGVDKKVVSASENGAEIFLCPDSGSDKLEENNYLKALETAKKIKTEMKIIPIKTIQEALNYLKK
ncbi:MAG: SepM family pheromone-processing serine protease [Lactovum sp.]